ncbi:hypothetical protein DXT74_06550 [Chromobacterium sp. Rain0013]|nr:hypothetical protein DXT74_06550 [Chromobacterium sp. Rain0013]
MKKSKFTEEQVVFVLHLAESGTTVAEVSRKMGVSPKSPSTLGRRNTVAWVSESYDV